MNDPYDRQRIAELRAQAIEMGADGLPADFIKVELGVPRSVRTVQRWISQAHGRRPSRRSIEQKNPLRDAVVKYMESHGLDRYYCVEGHRTVRPCAIRQLGNDIDSLVFVCDPQATVADV
jgi:hypothetical protein